MNAESITNLSNLATIVSCMFSIASFVAYMYERRRRQRERADERRRTWHSISLVKGLLYDVSKALEKDPNSVACHQAFGALEDMFKGLLREAVEKEDNFDIKTIGFWRKTGKLSSDWQERLALNLIDTKNISHQDIEGISKTELYSNWDQMDKDHPGRLADSDIAEQ